MFIQLDSTFQQYWLLALLALWAVFLFGGFAFGRYDTQQNRRMPAWTRMASSLTLVVAGWSWYLFVMTGAAGGFALAVAIGMTLGCAGDFFLADILPLPQPVLWGIAAFGLGHLFYIFACLNFGDQHGLAATTPRLVAWGVWLLIGLAGWYFVVFRGQKATVLHWAALPYALLLASTTGFATGMALQAPAFTTMAIGAALFLFSDLVLAAELFNNLKFPMVGDVIWLTYGPGQMLLVYAVNSALIVLGTS